MLHLLKEAALFIGGIMFFCMTLDRLIATRNPEEYEKKTKPTIAIILVFLCIVLGLGGETLIAMHVFSLMVMPTALAVINLTGVVMMYFIVKKNRLNMDYYYNFALGHKLQLRENIQTCATIYPNLILSSVSSIIGAFFYIGAIVVNDGSLSLLFMTIFNTGIAMYMNATTLMIFFLMKKIRQKLSLYFCHLGKVNSQTFDAKDIYFQQLNSQWNK